MLKKDKILPTSNLCTLFLIYKYYSVTPTKKVQIKSVAPIKFYLS